MNATLTAPAKFDRRAIATAAWSLVKTAGKTLSEGMKAAWAAAKQTIKTVMSNILATITVEDQHATPGTVPAQVFDFYLATETVAIAMRRPLREGGKAFFRLFTTSAPLRNLPTVEVAGRTYYERSNEGINSIADLDDARSQAAYGISAAEVAAVAAALNA